MEQPEGNIFYLEFKEPWFGGVDNLLLRMDMGESITLMELKEACDREGRELIIEIIDNDETDNGRKLRVKSN